MEDYGKSPEEAQQAVLLEEKLRGQETDLKAQTGERQKESVAEEQSLKDSIDRTVMNRRKELAANLNDEIAEERAASKRAWLKKERAKHIGKQERAAAESAPIEEEMVETGRRLRELFRRQQVPGILWSKLYYALYWPQHFDEWLQILLFVALPFVALPCGVYSLALPDSLQHIPALVLIYIADTVLIGGIYIVIGTQLKLRYLETLKGGRRMRNEIAEKEQELRRAKRSIQHDKSDGPYNLGGFDNEIAAAEQRLEATQQKKAEAFRIFDAEIADKIAEELCGEAAIRASQKKSQYEVAQHALTEAGKECQATILCLVEWYESILGKEFMTAEKIAAPKDIMENGTATNLAEAIACYQDRQESQSMVEETKSARTIWRDLVRIGIGLLLLLVLLSLYHGRKRYHAYAVINQQDVSQGSLVGYEPFQQGHLKYSKDGVSYISGKNDTYWTSSFEMKDLMIDVNRSYVVIADRSGNTLQIFNEKHGKTGERCTERTLGSTSIPLSGVAATLEEDSLASYIQFYKKDGSVLDIIAKALPEGNGYLTALDLSDDGSQVTVGVAHLEGGKLVGKIVVYDFSDSSGSGREDQMKGGITPYEGENLIPEVRYSRNGRAFAASTCGLYLFQVGKNGIEKGWKLVEKQEVIRSLCLDRNYVVIVLNGAEAQDNKPCCVELYNDDGDKAMHANFSEHYTSSFVDRSTVLLIGSDVLTVFLQNDMEQFSGAADFPLVRATRFSGENRYLWLGAAHIKKVGLK